MKYISRLQFQFIVFIKQSNTPCANVEYWVLSTRYSVLK